MPTPYETTELFAQADSDHALRRVRPLRLQHDAIDAKNYLPSLGLFGTAGNPNEVYNWRADTIPAIQQAIAARGLAGTVTIFNPQKENWHPDDAVVEAHHLARDAALVLPVLDITTGQASLAETGFAALGGTFRPQKVHMLIESGANFDDNVKRARTLTTLLATKTLQDFPINASMATDIQSMIEGGVQDVSRFAENLTSRVKTDVSYTIEQPLDLNPTIALVGSGAQSYDGSWYEGMRRTLDNYGVSPRQQYDAYVKDWSMDDALKELEHKTNDAVVLFAVTEDQDSYGAMGELGWLMTYCVLNGQKLGVYVEQHDSDPKSDQNRQRKLAMSHLGRHLVDFPDLPVFVAKSPQELALYGASELAKYQQLQKAAKAST